jgi:small-conductance mechanosensitive channel
MSDKLQMTLAVLTPFQFALYGLLAGVVLEFVALRRIEGALRRSGQPDSAAILTALHWAPALALSVLGLHESFRASVLRQSVQFDLDKVLEAAIILVFTIYAGRIVDELLRQFLKFNARAAPAASLFTSFARVAVWSIGLLLVLQAFEISITPLLTALGVGGLAVALALRDTLENLFSGLQIIASRQLRPGDYVRLEGGDEGVVSDITWRNTTIRDLSNNTVVVPNVKLAQAIFTNFTLPDREIAVPVNVLVPYDTDLEAVERIALDVARGVLGDAEVRVEGYEPFVRFQEFGSDNVRLSISLRAAEFVDQFALRSELLKRLHARFLSENIGAPFPASVTNTARELARAPRPAE